MNIIMGKILSEVIKEQPPKDFGNGPVISFLHELTISGKILGKDNLGVVNLKISKFNKNNSPLTSAGTEVKLIYSSKKGTKPSADGSLPEYHNLEELEVLLATTAFHDVSIVPASPITSIPLSAVHVKATSKDISMEVSGLLQALIGTGAYSDNTVDGLTVSGTVRLEEDLIAVLTLKRKIAKDFE